MLKIITDILAGKSNKTNIFSYSQINTFKMCPEQYKIIYLDGVRKKNESIEAFMGKRVHDAMEWLYKPENRTKPYLTFDSFCKKFDELWLENWHSEIHIADKKKSTDYYYSIGKRCISNYFRRYGPSFDQMVEGTEIKLNFLIGKYQFRGIIDRLDFIGPGKWIVHDYKTSKRVKTERQAMNDIQLALYQIAVEQNYGQVNEIELKWHFLRSGSEITVLHTREELKVLRKKIIKLVDQILVKTSEKKIFPKESMLCNWCYLWEECSAKDGSNPVKKAV